MTNIEMKKRFLHNIETANQQQQIEQQTRLRYAFWVCLFVSIAGFAALYLR